VRTLDRPIIADISIFGRGEGAGNVALTSERTETKVKAATRIARNRALRGRDEQRHAGCFVSERSTASAYYRLTVHAEFDASAPRRALSSGLSFAVLHRGSRCGRAISRARFRDDRSIDASCLPLMESDRSCRGSSGSAIHAGERG